MNFYSKSESISALEFQNWESDKNNVVSPFIYLVFCLYIYQLTNSVIYSFGGHWRKSWQSLDNERAILKESSDDQADD